MHWLPQKHHSFWSKKVTHMHTTHVFGITILHIFILPMHFLTRWLSNGIESEQLWWMWCFECKCTTIHTYYVSSPLYNLYSCANPPIEQFHTSAGSRSCWCNPRNVFMRFYTFWYGGVSSHLLSWQRHSHLHHHYRILIRKWESDSINTDPNVFRQQ